MPSLKFGSFALLSVSALLLASAPLDAGESVSHPTLGLRLTVPDGFAPAPVPAGGKVIYVFQRPPTGDQKSGTFILVSRLGGVIGRERLDPKQLAARSATASLHTERWQTFDIDVLRVPEQGDAGPTVTLNAQVPLKPEAVQVSVIGEAGREEELKALLRAVLAATGGESNWLTAAERQTKAADGITSLVIAVGVLAAIALAVWSSLRKRKPTRRKVRRSRRDDPDTD